MNEQNRFLELLKDLTDVAKASDNSITTEEIDSYLSDMELTSEQMEVVYDYLCKGHIRVIGHVRSENNADSTAENAAENVAIENTTAENAAANDIGKGVSVHSGMYRKNVRQLPKSAPEEMEQLCAAIIDGNATADVKEKIIKNYLYIAVNYASKYANRGISSDELIQEGNLALVLAVNEVCSDEKIRKMYSDGCAAAEICEKYFRNSIKKSIICCIDGETQAESELSAALAKAELVNEAVKHLAGELGRVASLREVSEYTHIEESEIQDIVNFSGDIISLGDGIDIPYDKQ